MWLYVIAGGLCFAEAAILVGMVLPGETALLVAGVFCAAGKLNLWVMIIVAAVCAIAGDSVGFEFGKKFGPSLRRSRLGTGSANTAGPRSTGSCTATAARRCCSAGSPRCSARWCPRWPG